METIKEPFLGREGSAISCDAAGEDKKKSPLCLCVCGEESTKSEVLVQLVGHRTLLLGLVEYGSGP